MKIVFATNNSGKLREVKKLFEKTGLSIDDVDVMIPHQANFRILNKLLERLEIDTEKVVLNVMNYGNTSAASIPIALDEANRSGRIKTGDNENNIRGFIRGYDGVFSLDVSQSPVTATSTVGFRCAK